MFEEVNILGGQEEYIWAMRSSAYHDTDAESWKERRNLNHQLSSLSSAHSKKEEPDVKQLHENQTKVMASLVPDEVIYNVNDYTPRYYDACLLFGDVSGFTELCEKYNKTGVAGPSRLTQVLNKYLGAMVQEILSHNGDILKFSGDAFLAFWKCTENETMRDAVHEALDCALIIQKTYGSYLTDVGVIIRVKLAISAGPVLFSLIGDEKFTHFVAIGKPIWDVKAAEHISSAGEIIVSPAAFHYTNFNEYIAQEMGDGIHVKVLGIGPNWRSVQKNIRNQQIGKSFSDDAISGYAESSSSSSDLSSVLIEPEPTMDEFSLRPAVNAATRLNIKNDLRKFIISPVMKSIDMDEPFEYLTEMRQVVVVFLNLETTKVGNRELLQVSDESFKIVCGVVNEMKGCVNKVSLFDKDLMMVVIFGLRGLKHELESQIALRCAHECRQAICQINLIRSVSIGVTTGKTYCGVFGHTLRREYTVISLLVNKAARLMCAYKNKVTCDRETFLHSKMEARNFILQEHKDLKGISNPGPVYEFKEIIIDHDVIPRISLFPLLGRDEEIRVYKKMLKDCLQATMEKTLRIDKMKKLLIIEGVARQGKTRLLEEMIYCTPSMIPVNRFTLTKRDSKIPFETLRLIFNLPLGLTLDSTIKERETKLLKALAKMKVPDLLCCLNVAFNVSFKLSDLYQSLSKEQREMVFLKMIRQLYVSCFSVFWVIAIDDAEYMDKESWQYFNITLDMDFLLTVITIGPGLELTDAELKKLAVEKSVSIIELKAIDRWFHGGLACQILDVYAIPPELEKVIQARSNGNPGWIESFLISLIQAEGLYILQTNLKQIHILGLICPPLYMMTRMTSWDAMEWKKIMEERSVNADIRDSRDDWKIYIDTCRDSYLNITMREQLESQLIEDGLVPVCIISPNFNVEDVDPELSMDVIILKTFDSLNSYEQLLVKCSAILGNQFSRDMLLYVMSATVARQAAQAVQKLFEIRVLSCAQGDFLEGGNMVFRERLLNPNEGSQIKCECRGVKIDSTCIDLPKYASCGYMQFRSSMFRDITYNLLTDNQKKEFHYRAMKYLEKETRRCRACGNGFFETILGAKLEHDFVDKKRKDKHTGSSSWDETSSTGISRRISVYSGTSSIIQKYVRDGGRSDSQSVTNASQILSEPKARNFKSMWGFRYINNLKQSFSLTRAFSSEDFIDCQCNLILNTTYAQLIEHCRGAANWSKLIDAMLQYTHICIISSNVPLAIRILEEALTVLEDNQEPPETNWKTCFVRGKIFTLLGQCRIELGQLDEAEIYLMRSLQEHGFKFPQNACRKQLKTLHYRLKQYFAFYILPASLTKSSVDYWGAIFSNNVAECLSHLCTLYMAKLMWKNAELAAVWSLNQAMAAFTDIIIVSTAFANLIQVSQHFGKTDFCIALEIHSLRLCHLKTQNIEAEHLQAIAKLYSVIFFSRMLRSDMEKSIHIGYIVLRISSTVHAIKIILPLLPLLIQSLLMGKHVSNTISLMQDLEYFANEDSDNSGRVWYYALCVVFHLETGYCIIPYQMAEKFFQLQSDNLITIRDPDARQRYFAVMWLWCIRNQKWDAAALWCIRTKDFSILTENDSLANKFTALYILEGLILYLCCKLDRRNISAMHDIEQEIDMLIKALERIAKRTQIIRPRFLHLKAFYRFVRYNDSKVFALMDKAKKLALKIGNSLEASWIEHNLKAWTKALPAPVVDFWREHCELDTFLDFRELEVNVHFGYFTLPAPLYV